MGRGAHPRVRFLRLICAAWPLAGARRPISGIEAASFRSGVGEGTKSVVVLIRIPCNRGREAYHRTGEGTAVVGSSPPRLGSSLGNWLNLSGIEVSVAPSSHHSKRRFLSLRCRRFLASALVWEPCPLGYSRYPPSCSELSSSRVWCLAPRVLPARQAFLC